MKSASVGKVYKKRLGAFPSARIDGKDDHVLPFSNKTFFLSSDFESETLSRKQIYEMPRISPEPVYPHIPKPLDLAMMVHGDIPPSDPAVLPRAAPNKKREEKTFFEQIKNLMGFN